MVRILVDTSADYTVAEVQAKGLEMVPIHITIGEKDYRDAYDLTKDEFYKLLTENEEFPKTAQPSPQDFLDTFEDAKEKGDDLIYISLSSSLSGTFQSATLAKNIADYENIYLVDSLTATHMIRLLADHAKKLAEEGKSAAEIVEALESLKSRVKVFAAVDTMEYLYKGGRVSKATAAIGELAKIKPLITVSTDGHVAVAGKCMGKNKAISTLLKLIGEQEIDESFPMYSVYTAGSENVVLFENRLKEAGHAVTDRLQIGATIGAHLGAGVYGYVFVTKNE